MPDVADQLILALNAFCNKYVQVTNKLFRTAVRAEMPELDELKPFLTARAGQQVQLDLLGLINGLLTLSGKSKLATVLDKDNSTIIAFTWVKFEEDKPENIDSVEVPNYGEGVESETNVDQS